MPQPRALSEAQLRAVDELAASHLGLPSCVLMENAGRGAAELLLSVLRMQTLAGARSAPPWSVAVLCGSGGNGGDGYVLARRVANAGHRVEVLSAAPRAKLSGDTRMFRTACERSSIPVADADDSNAWSEAIARLERADAVVDALLGVGARGAPREPMAELIRRCNASPAPLKFALDLPSGMEADTGGVAGECFRAQFTAAFAAPKRGFESDSARPFVGRVYVVDIGVDVERLLRAADGR